MNDDLIVTGGACVGTDCVVGDADFGRVSLKQDFVSLSFIDTHAVFDAGSDWLIFVNELIGPNARFSIFDLDAGKTPFTLISGAPDDSLYVRSNGNLGLGTSAPAQDIHVISGNSPALRLEQDVTGGLTAQTWDVLGNETGFSVRDVTSASKVPFKIQNGAPTDSLFIRSTGAVGIGTTTPAAKLHLFGSALNDVFAGFGPSPASGPAFNIGYGADSFGRGSGFLNVRPDASAVPPNPSLRFATADVQRMIITNTGSIGIGTLSPASLLHVNGGDVRVTGGSFIDDGVTLNAPDYVFEPDYLLMPIEELGDFVAREKHLPNVPSAAEIKGNGLNISQFQMRLLEKVEELTLYLIDQQEEIETLRDQKAGLEERLAALEKVVEERN